MKKRMSLTIFVHSELPVVAIVRWFFDAKGNILFASGPVVRMPVEEFRARGYDWVRRHFEEYQMIRLSEKDVIPVFQAGEAKKTMKGCKIVDIGRDPTGLLIFSPKMARRYDLAWLEGVGKQYRRTIPESSPADVFWTTFDEVLAAAPVI